ncbi:helix-turn-helix transcriptional regulator [Flavivirga aquimarina]|uniref:Helix-turn-helix transcriptional regulator n=1 Tax=Flavivirga aquimarina TaxID=2027862 RepID=A0ABT8WE47_9FLAO|nr:helix-turn-helix transcriptional regulator [Flavivirga aquimarina]MDO5971388.1 helix-turn-helix transcriptional regulator [Flavivirga aquimarina]
MKNLELSIVIKKLRTDKDFSQEKLSEKSGLSLRTIQRLENGETEPRGDTLKRLINALELPTDYFNKLNQCEKDVKISTNIKRRTIPWYIIGFTIIGSSFGFILGLVLVNLKIIPINDISLALVISIGILFGSIGIVIGNTFEKRYNK